MPRQVKPDLSAGEDEDAGEIVGREDRRDGDSGVGGGDFDLAFGRRSAENVPVDWLFKTLPAIAAVLSWARRRRETRLSPVARELLRAIDADTRGPIRGVSLMIAMHTRGFHVPYLWSQSMGALSVEHLDDLSATLQACDDLVRLGYLEPHYAGGALRQFRRTGKRGR